MCIFSVKPCSGRYVEDCPGEYEVRRLPGPCPYVCAYDVNLSAKEIQTKTMNKNHSCAGCRRMFLDEKNTKKRASKAAKKRALELDAEEEEEEDEEADQPGPSTKDTNDTKGSKSRRVEGDTPVPTESVREVDGDGNVVYD